MSKAQKPNFELFDAADEEEDTQQGKYLTFNLAKEDYGIEIKYVTEIIGIQRITEVPDMPDFLKGVINLRGKIIPVMDVRIRFSLPAREYDDRTCIVVVDIEGRAMGLVVDRMNEVSEFAFNRHTSMCAKSKQQRSLTWCKITLFALQLSTMTKST